MSLEWQADNPELSERFGFNCYYSYHQVGVDQLILPNKKFIMLTEHKSIILSSFCNHTNQ